MDKLRKALVGLSLLGLMVTAAGSIVSASSVPASSLGAEPMGPSEVSGRTLCDGSVDRVFTDLSGAPADSIERLQAKYENVPGFRSVVYDGQAAVVVVEARALEEWADLIDKTVRVAPSCVSEDLIEAAAAVVRDLDLGEDESAVSGYDALVDAAFVLSARPDSEIEAALDRSFASSGGSDQILKSRASGLLRLRQIQLGPVRSTRNADTSPHWGGARTRTSLGGGLIGLCTTGFYINSATNGTAMVTAGHCANDGQNGLTVRNGDASVVMGTTEGGRFPDPDLGLIDGGAYSGRTYSSTNQTSNKAIASGGGPATGTVYCQYGATSLRRCYSYSSLSVQLCDGGCTNGLAFAQGPSGPGGSMGSGGDSGGGVFRELTSTTVGARGIVIARTCDASDCYAWDHRYQTVLSTYDATLVPG